jgi:hypothetical protein
MPGRPSPILRWTSTGVYPPVSGAPWEGQPLGLAPVGSFFTPNTKPSPEEFNYLFGTFSGDQQSTLDWCGAFPAMNWGPSGILATGAPGMGAAVWDGINQVWLVSQFDNAGPTVSLFSGLGEDGFLVTGARYVNNQVGWGVIGNQFSVSGATPYNIVGITPDPGGGWHIFAIDGTGDMRAFYTATASGTWGATRTLASATGTVNVEALWFGSKVLYAVASSAGAINAGISYTSNQGSSWVDTLTYNTIGCNTRWLFKTNGQQVIAIPATTVTSTFQYFTSSDGATWSLRNPGGVVNLHDQPAGLAWGQDAAGPCWFLAVNKTVTSSPTTCAIYRSSDGVSWTLAGIVPQGGYSVVPGPTSLNVYDLAALGSLLVATVTEGPGTTNRLICSTDGGQNWRYAPAVLAANIPASLNLKVVARINASDTQFLAWNSASFRWSLNGGVYSPVL